MGRVLAAAVVVLALGASSAHASVIVSDRYDEQGYVRMHVDATQVDGVALRLSADPAHGGIVVDAGAEPITADTSSCHAISEGLLCWGYAPQVTLGDGDDEVVFTDVWNATVDGGLGDDTVRTDQFHDLAFDGGDGSDHLDLTRHAYGVSIYPDDPYRAQILSVERLTTTEHQDYVDVAPGQRVSLGAGADSVDADNDAPDRVDCGPGEDTATVDPEDRVESCENVWGSGGGQAPIPAMPWFPLPGYGPDPLHQRPPIGVSYGQFGLDAPAKVEGEALRFTLDVGYANTVGLALAVAPWRGDAPPATLTATVPADVDHQRGRRRANVVLPLPAHLLEALRREGRLRVQGTALLHLPWAAFERKAAFTVVAPRASRVVLDGRRRKGSFGVQRMRGGPRGDLLSAESADDELFGLGGTDALHGGTGNDALDGGDGDDLLDGGDGDDVVLGGPGDDDLVEARFGNDTLDGGPGDDVIHGRRGTDTIHGGDGDDVIDGGSGIDRVDCGPGEDIVLVNALREPRVNCEEVQMGESVVHRRCERGGTDGPETVLGTDANDRCSGRGGDDDVEGRAGDDLLEGGPGNDRIFGRFGRDVLRGDDGNDELEGGRGRDRLDGGKGDDQLNGGFHRDTLAARDGNDVVIARGGGTDRIDCGPGNDLAYVDSRDTVRGCERVKRSGGRTPRR